LGFFAPTHRRGSIFTSGSKEESTAHLRSYPSTCADMVQAQRTSQRPPESRNDDATKGSLLLGAVRVMSRREASSMILLQLCALPGVLTKLAALENPRHAQDEALHLRLVKGVSEGVVKHMRIEALQRQMTTRRTSARPAPSPSMMSSIPKAPPPPPPPSPSTHHNHQTQGTWAQARRQHYDLAVVRVARPLVVPSMCFRALPPSLKSRRRSFEGLLPFAFHQASKGTKRAPLTLPHPTLPSPHTDRKEKKEEGHSIC